MTPIAQLQAAQSPLTLARAPQGFLPWLMTDLARAAKRRAVFIAADEAAMRGLAETAAFFAPEIEVLTYPAWDCLPYDRSSPSLRTTSERLATLAALQRKAAGPQLLVTTINAITQRTLTPFRVRQLSATLRRGEAIDREHLIGLLHANGYARTDTVRDAGEFAVRGSLVDLFPAGQDHGLRIDFFGDEIDSLRAFDPADQRSIGAIETFALLPATEALLDEETIKRFRTRYRDVFGAASTGDPLYQAVSEGRRITGMDHWLPLFEARLATLFDHLGEGAILVRDAGVEQALAARNEAIADYHQNRVRAATGEPGSYRPLAPDALYLSANEWADAVAAHAIHQASPFDAPEGPCVIDFGIHAARDFSPDRAGGQNVYAAATAHAERLARDGAGLILACYSSGSRERLAGLLAEHGLRTSLAESWQDALGLASAFAVRQGKRGETDSTPSVQPDPSPAPPAGRSGAAALIILPLEHGFRAPAFELLTEQDLLGDRLVRRRKRKKDSEAFLSELATMAAGDLVVHRDHGIGRFEGLTSILVGNAPHDCVALQYAGGDRVYVPVENIDILSRYGSDAEGVALDKLGGVAWQSRKARMKERIREIAGDLIRTAAERALREADPAAADPDTYPAFVDRFAFAETDDQDRAIADVLSDLGSGKPMDRLVCGDVGFGKTEVALRAAFVAAMAGMQVALICPTTLLARQHYSNFAERFRGFPVNVGRLSRLVPAGEARSVREGLADGRIDIVIGTHAVLAKGIRFKRLGLVIVDEEQRFGVVHKERLKALKTDVHMLTLTATPIPRTLQMAMTGLRDLSVIQTPPIDRLAVRTYVMPWDPVVLREALLREHYRGGQSFFVTPRVADLPDIEEFFRKTLPELKYVVAHGQMAASEVEERMSAFYDHKYDVLVSTTIIESGLDIPSANTMIVNRADRFGLAQLYQLRGRVGRAKTRAYAYLTTAENGALTEAAEKRLRVLSDLDTLGAGFQLASHDLDLRGAGNLLGDEQSGHISEVGFELYQSMLEEAILEAKAGGLAAAASREYSPQITVDAPILIPDEYVPDLDLRMSLYRRINELAESAEIEAFAAELIDRFGPLPPPTDNLLILMNVKLNARRANIAKIDTGPRGALVSFRNDSFPNVEGLLAYVERLRGTAKLRPDMKLSITRQWPDAKARLNGLLQLSKGLAQAAG